MRCFIPLVLIGLLVLCAVAVTADECKSLAGVSCGCDTPCGVVVQTLDYPIKVVDKQVDGVGDTREFLYVRLKDGDILLADFVQGAAPKSLRDAGKLPEPAAAAADDFVMSTPAAFRDCGPVYIPAKKVPVFLRVNAWAGDGKRNPGKPDCNGRGITLEGWNWNYYYVAKAPEAVLRVRLGCFQTVEKNVMFNTCWWR